MRPALIVDLDWSSIQALRFVLEADVLVPGSYVCLDDIMPWVWAGAKQPALEQKLAFEEATREFGLEWEEVPLNATRRDYVYTRPVLMLRSCARCNNAHRETRANRLAERTAAEAAPPACLVPAAGGGGPARGGTFTGALEAVLEWAARRWRAW